MDDTALVTAADTRAAQSIPHPRSPGTAADSGSEPTEAPPPIRRGRLRAPTVWTLVVLLVATVGGAFATHALVAQQEQRLVRERAAQLGLVFNQAFSSLQTSLGSIGTALKVGQDPRRFKDLTAPQFALSPNLTTLSLLRRSGDGFVVALASGPQLQAGDVVAGARAATLRQALTTPKLVSTPVLSEQGKRALGFALGPPFAPAGTVLYEESTVQTTSRTPSSQSSAFDNVYVTLFTSSKPRADQLIISTAPDQGIPKKSSFVVIPVGASDWTLGIAARHPLSGPVTSLAHWFVLGIGLLGTLLVALLVEVVLRRRDYALQLVAERTGELRSSLVELEATQRQLVRQERLAAVGQLASTVGHELRNPLGVISNALFLIRNATRGTATGNLERHLATAEREVGAATLIVSDLLEYARSREPILGAVDVPGLLEESLEVASPPPAVTVTRDVPDGLPPLAADRDQLRQVLLNLITNACDAMPEGGDLRIACHRDEDGMVVLSIADTGEGMDSETRSRIFEPFFTTKARGVGLGLAVTDRVVAQHGGSIAVESSPGRGTTFILCLPAGAEEKGSPS